jgi:serine/threonine protein phosphatase PrpC
MLRVAEKHFAKSDTGRQRGSNEDALFARAPLFAVADGMGGARAGEIASDIVVQTLQEGMPPDGSAEERLAAMARDANERIHTRSRADEREVGMGTTLTAAFVGDGDIAFAHVGDSRAYRFRGGELERLTQDHSLVEEMLRRGKITEEEAAEHPQRSVITRALGPEPAVEVDTFTHPARPGDLFLLCSDGLSSMVRDEDIAAILREAGSVEKAGQRLIDAANEAGGRDNITVILFRVEEVGAPAGADQPTQVGSDAPSVAEVEEAAAAREPPAPKRTAPLPPRAETPAPPRRRRGRRLVGPLVVLVILAALVAGAWTASRAVYFVATDKHGFVAIYRGLPYDGPAGVRFYERWYVSGVPAAEIPGTRRKSILDHRLRSQHDASDLVRKLELGQVGR